MQARLAAIESELTKKNKFIETSKQRQLTLVEEKQSALDLVEALQRELSAHQGERESVNAANDNQLSELMERIHGKDLVIEENTSELRQLQQKI